MLALARQRWIFLGTAVSFISTSFFLPRLSGNVEMLIAAAVILFLGVPHGALDVLYLRKVLLVRSASKVAALLFLYLSVATGVVALWLFSPLVFLISFLIASGFHFSGDPEEGSHFLTRCSIGAGVIVLPSLLYRSELTNLYSLLTNSVVADIVVKISVPGAYLVIGLSMVAVVSELLKEHYMTAAELVTAVLLATFVSPLLAFTIYFCLMHSARHILRTGELVSMSTKAFLLECALPMVAVFIATAIAWSQKNNLRLDASIIRIVFVMLAALTAPHMLIVEPVRFGGWQKPRPSDMTTQ